MKACDTVQFSAKVFWQTFGWYMRIHVGDITGVKVKLQSDESLKSNLQTASVTARRIHETRNVNVSS